MTTRIDCLEEIVRSLKAEAKEEKMGRLRGNMSPTKNMPSNPVSIEFHQRVLPYAAVNSPFYPSPTKFSNDAISGDKNNACGGEIEKGTSIILCLQQQIEELGTALQQSEEERANAIEKFQNER